MCRRLVHCHEKSFDFSREGGRNVSLRQCFVYCVFSTPEVPSDAFHLGRAALSWNSKIVGFLRSYELIGVQ